MKMHFRAPIGHKARWAVGITLAGVVAGGAFAAAATTGSTASAASPANSASTTELNALVSASNVSASNVSASNATPASNRVGPLRRLRRLGGEYGSFTVTTKEGTRTLAFERGTIQSVNGSDVVIQAANGTTMTWLLVSDTVVRDHGKAATSALAQGQLVFAGGPVVSGARDARLIVIRTAVSSGSPAAGTSAS